MNMEGGDQLDDQAEVTPTHHQKRTVQSEDSISKRRKLDKSYRVRGVPLQWGSLELHSFLDDRGDFPGLSIKSLALEFHGKWRTATITYNTPSSKETTWFIPLPALIGGGLTFDSEFFGLTTLYCPPTGHEVDVLAISGVGGHAFGSFKDKNSEHMWLRDTLPKDLTANDGKQPITRVLLYGYESRILQSNNTQDLEDIASAFRGSLISLVNTSTIKPMIFIAHSFGGLVVKQALISMSESEGEDVCKLSQAIYGLLFFGVPQAGMQGDSLLPLAKEGSNRPLIESIKRGSKALGRQRYDFSKYLEKRSLEVFCFYETMESPTPIQDEHGKWARKGAKILLVDQDSATDCHRRGADSTHACAIASNHSDMVKFSPHDHNYDIVLGRLIGLTNRATTVTQDRAHESSPQLSPTQRERLINLLKFQQIDERLVNLKLPKANTCKWILQTLEYRTWIDASTMSSEHYRLLWIKGKPGAGKSIIMKYLFQQKNKIPGAEPISFFFNARGNVLERSTLGLYRALLLQLFKRIPDLQPSLEILGFHGTKMVEWRFQSLKNVLIEAVLMLKSQVFCYIDALDECPEAEIRDMISFFHDIRDAAASSRGGFYACFSSRHYPQLSVKKSLQIILEKQPEHDLDIEQYIETELHVGKSSQVARVKQDIRDKASGVFLWVALVVPMLNQAFDHGEFKSLMTLLKDLPPGLENLIRDILTRTKSDMDALLCCLQWVLFSPEPLQLPTLYFAIKGALDDDGDNEGLRWNRNEDFVSLPTMFRFVLSASKGLVEETKSEEPTVQFIHESVRDFLIGNKGLQELWPQLGPHFEARSHHLLAKYCIKHIEFHSLNNTELTTPPPTPDDSSVTRTSLRCSHSKTIPSFQFLKYAVGNVLYHSNEAQAHGEDQMQFIDQFPKHTWIRYHNLLIRHKWYHKRIFTPYNSLSCLFSLELYPEDINLLYILAKLDLVHLIRLLPDRIRHLDIVGGLYHMPLLAALGRGNKEAARDLGFQVFIDQGILIHNIQECEDYFSSLTPQSIRYEGDIRRTLLEIRCFPTINALILQRTDQDSSWIFSKALEFRVWKTVELLIEKGSNIEAADKDGSTPLLIAAAAATSFKFGSGDLVKKLLDLGANIEATNKRGCTPLLAAVKSGYSPGVIKHLLDRGANIEATDENGCTPLLAAAKNAFPADIIKQLLDNGANIEATDKDGCTPLLAAAENEYPADIVKQLLEKGANIEATDKNGYTPLLAAARSFAISSVDVVKQLLDKGANIEAIDNHGCTPLLAAARVLKGSSVDIFKQLLDKGANIEATDKNNCTPLLVAARTIEASSVDVIKQLLDKGANIEATDKNGCTPLLAAAEAAVSEEAVADATGDVETMIWPGPPDVIEELLKRGANIEVVDKHGLTPLLAVKNHKGLAAVTVAKLLRTCQKAGSGL